MRSTETIIEGFGGFIEGHGGIKTGDGGSVG